MIHLPNRPVQSRLQLFTIAVLAIGAAACADRASEDTTRVDTLAARTESLQSDTTAPSIYAVLSERDGHSRFTVALDSAGLDGTLAGPGPFTVFAPVDSAFRSLEDLPSLLAPDRRNDLRALLLHHIANGALTTQDLQAGATLRTLEGSDLSVDGSDDSLRVGGARVIEADVQADNGVIHRIDEVLEPGNLEGGA